jgi:hypothetical protein
MIRQILVSIGPHPVPGMKRPQFSLRVLFIVIAIVCLAFGWLVMATSGPANWRNYNKIKIGMAEADVDALLGGPGEELAPLTYEDVQSDEQRILLSHTWPHYERNWLSNSHMITLLFDRQHSQVVAKYYKRAPDTSWPSRIADWIGL